jgi:hypothetical protein
MKIFTAMVPPSARRQTLGALAAFCLAGWSLQAATVVPANAAPAHIAAAQTSSQPAWDQDIRDIRPPYHMPPGWLGLAWVGGALALAGLGYGAWRWRHRLELRVKLPYEIALEQLAAARRLMQPEQARAFSIAVSEVVRDYIEKSFPERAAHRTTEEFLRDLATRPDSPLVVHQPVLADFLRYCDLAKFARWILSMPQMEAMLQSAGTFIVATGKPVDGHSVDPMPPTPAAGAGAVMPGIIPANSGATLSAAATLNSPAL